MARRQQVNTNLSSGGSLATNVVASSEPVVVQKDTKAENFLNQLATAKQGFEQILSFAGQQQRAFEQSELEKVEAETRAVEREQKLESLKQQELSAELTLLKEEKAAERQRKAEEAARKRELKAQAELARKNAELAAMQSIVGGSTFEEVLTNANASGDQNISLAVNNIVADLVNEEVRNEIEEEIRNNPKLGQSASELYTQRINERLGELGIDPTVVDDIDVLKKVAKSQEGVLDSAIKEEAAFEAAKIKEARDAKISQTQAELLLDFEDATPNNFQSLLDGYDRSLQGLNVGLEDRSKRAKDLVKIIEDRVKSGELTKDKAISFLESVPMKTPSGNATSYAFIKKDIEDAKRQINTFDDAKSIELTLQNKAFVAMFDKARSDNFDTDMFQRGINEIATKDPVQAQLVEDQIREKVSINDARHVGKISRINKTMNNITSRGTTQNIPSSEVMETVDHFKQQANMINGNENATNQYIALLGTGDVAAVIPNRSVRIDEGMSVKDEQQFIQLSKTASLVDNTHNGLAERMYSVNPQLNYAREAQLFSEITGENPQSVAAELSDNGINVADRLSTGERALVKGAREAVAGGVDRPGVFTGKYVPSVAKLDELEGTLNRYMLKYPQASQDDLIEVSKKVLANAVEYEGRDYSGTGLSSDDIKGAHENKEHLMGIVSTMFRKNFIDQNPDASDEQVQQVDANTRKFFEDKADLKFQKNRSGDFVVTYKNDEDDDIDSDVSGLVIPVEDMKVAFINGKKSELIHKQEKRKDFERRFLERIR